MTDEPRDEEIARQIHAPIEVLLQQTEAEWTLIMRRTFPHSPKKLWRMLTRPDLLERWSPVVPDRALDRPGPATCREHPHDTPIDAEVLIADAPRKLVHRWGPELLSWTITRAANSGATLELRQTLNDPTRASLYAAGWQVCLGRLAAEEDGVDRERVVGDRARAYGCQELIEHHREAFAASGTEHHERNTMTTETTTSKIVGTVVCLPVRDPAIALNFYRSVFDLPDLEASEGIIAVELPNLSLFLIEEQAFETYSKKAGRGVAYPGKGTGVILSCAIESREAVDEMLDTADAKGGTVTQQGGVDEEMGLYLGYFVDPDGHHWELAYASE